MNGLLIVLLLSVHALLVTLYADLIRRGISRLDRRFLVVAVLLPFVGELCLFVAEFGLIPEKPKYDSPFHDHTDLLQDSGWQLPENWEELLEGEEGPARELILQIINHEPEKNVDALKRALKSPSSEVCHIAAAQMMKLHQRHEDEIAEAEREYTAMPGNMEALGRWIDAVRLYRVSGLLDHASLSQIQEEEKKLLDQYLTNMPYRYDFRAERLRLALEMGEPELAIQQADLLIQNPNANPSDWNLAYRAYESLGDDAKFKQFLLKRKSVLSQRSSDFHMQLLNPEA